MNTERTPELRPVDVQPVELRGQRAFLVKDPDGLADEPLVLTPLGGWMLQHFDGRTTLEEIRCRVREETGEAPPEGLVEELLEVLDEHHLLHNERSRDKLERMREAFRQSPTREATLPGRGIPADPSELSQYFQRVLEPDGYEPPDPPYRGLIVPHIDYERGKGTYSRVLACMRKLSPEVERVILVGICHNPTPVPFALTRKSFATPFGSVPTDEQAVEQLAEPLPYDVEEGAIAHRLEHSIEIPLLLLKHARPEQPFRIVPLLCSYRSQSEHPDLRRSVERSLRELLDDERTLLVAGVDFAHVGRQFGDPEPLEDSDYERVEREDREMMRTVVSPDAAGFESHIQSDGNARRVCGYPALRTVLPLFDEGEHVDYGQWQDPHGTVTYGAAVLR